MVELLCASEAGKILGLSSEGVHYHEKCGRLKAVMAEFGPSRVMRLYRRDDVEKFLRQRETASTTEGKHV